MGSFRLIFQPLFTWPGKGYLVALAAVFTLSGVVDFVTTHVHVANTSMAYLIVVLIAALALGRGPAVLAAVASVVSLTWFFAEPVYSLHVADPGEWLLLLTFLMTAVITSELTAAARRRAREAQQREREAIVLAELLRLLVEWDLGTAVRGLAGKLHAELDLAAAIVEAVEGSFASETAEVGDEAALQVARLQSVSPAGEAARYWREEASVTVRGRPIGRICVLRSRAGASFAEADRRLVAVVAVQLGLICERERLRSEATETEILRRSDDLKTALLRSVSHDLRTPLSSIVAAADSLLEENLAWTARERRAFAQTIKRGAERLNHVVEHLLDLSRIEAGILHPQKDWYDVRSLVDDVIGRLEVTVGTRLIGVDVPDGLPPVHLDYAQMSQVLVNLIENAAKYASPEAEIRMSVRYGQGELRIEVADAGPGIPEEVLPHVFEPFYRGDARASRPQGTGLGLAVAKGLVVAHAGNIWAENRPEGGARFVITLPSVGPEEARADMVEANV